MKIKRAKLKIVRLLITALLLCSFPSVKAYSDDSYVSSFNSYFYIDGVLESSGTEDVWNDGENFYSEISIPFSTTIYSFTGISFSPSVNFDYTNFYDVPGYSDYTKVIFGSNFNSSTSYNCYFYFTRSSVTPTPAPTDTPTPSPTAAASYGTGSQACEIRWFQGSYPASNSGSYFYPSGSWSTGIRVMYPYLNGQYSSGSFYPPEGYAIDISQFPVSFGRMSLGITEGLVNKYAGTFSTNEDGSVIYFNNIRVGSSYGSGDYNTAFVAVVPVTPTPTLSPTPTLTPYPSSAPAAFSTYTISFVAPNGYVVGTVRPVLSVGSSYSGAISSLTFSFLDGWFSYGDEVNGDKGSFTWDYSYSENFGEYLWHFSTSSWPESESINIPIYRLDGEYPDVVPDLNNVSDLFDTIGKTDPANFSWFYDGLQAFIDINWNWAYLMLLFPLFVMLWAFFRRH